MTAQCNWQAEEVVRAVDGQCLHEQSWQAHGVAIDSRGVQPGDLFVALKGPTHDAHEFVAAAFAAGASAAIVDHQPPQVAASAPLITVDDTFTALEKLGRAGRARAAARIVAVTGSVGKTSSKEMLRQMLHNVGDAYANVGSLNNHWGVPLSLARLPAEARFGVFEIGMNHPGELGPLSKMVQPHVALITTIEAVHLEHFESIEEIADAKAEIFEGLRPDGAAVLNHDNGQYARLAAAAKASGVKKILGFGKDSKCDARLLDCEATLRGSMIKAEIMGRKISYAIGAPGLHIAINSVGALLAAAALGADIGACADAMTSYQQPKGRGVIQSLHLPVGEVTLIDESYNASPVAVRAAITVLGNMAPLGSGRRVLVLADMRELGSTTPELHAGLAQDIIAAKIDQVFCCGKMMKYLYDALPAGLRAACAVDSKAMVPLVLEAVRAGDIVTIKGSHSMQMELVVEALQALDTSPASHKRAG